MIFDVDNLYIDHKSQNTLSLLESMPRIDRRFVEPHPATVPLVENFNYGGAYIARYGDLLKLANEYEVSIQESINMVLKENQLKPNYLIVSVEEWRPYVDPKVFYRFSNDYVIQPEINTPAYRLCEYCMGAFLESGDPTWLDVYFYETPGNDILSLLENKIIFTDKNTSKAMVNDNGTIRPATTEEIKQRNRMEKMGATTYNNGAIDLNQSYGEGIAQPNKQDENLWEKYANDGSLDEKIKQASGKSQPNSETKPSGPSWLSQKWTALKNWWNNAGQADSNGNVGWFSNLVGKFKSALGIGQNKTAATPAATTSTTTDNKETPKNDATNAQPAQPAQQQTPAEKAAEEKSRSQEQMQKDHDKEAEGWANMGKTPEPKKDAGAAPATNPPAPATGANTSNPNASAK